MFREYYAPALKKENSRKVKNREFCSSRHRDGNTSIFMIRTCGLIFSHIYIRKYLDGSAIVTKESFIMIQMFDIFSLNLQILVF